MLGEAELLLACAPFLVGASSVGPRLELSGHLVEPDALGGELLLRCLDQRRPFDELVGRPRRLAQRRLERTPLIGELRFSRGE